MAPPVTPLRPVVRAGVLLVLSLCWSASLSVRRSAAQDIALEGPIAVDAGAPGLPHDEAPVSVDAGSAVDADVANLPIVPVVVAPPPAEPVSPTPQSAPTGEMGVVDVTSRSARTSAQRLQDSAEAVTVIDTKRARQQSADLGEVLARTQGVGVRREGGLGSDATISLNGLSGDQVRLFLDGVPLEWTGYPFDLANIPVNLVERMEVYRGVVPIRFGADALGGAINVVSDQRYETHGGASYQVGSFGTHRASVNGRYVHDRSGFVVGGSAYVDSARNDYEIDVLLPTPDGGSVPTKVKRFHDGYRAYGGNVELGVVDRPWARRLLVQGFFATYDKDIQNDAGMSVPFGEVTNGKAVFGVSTRYEVDLTPSLSLSLLANYARRFLDFQDLSPTMYLWTGERGRPVGREGARGEIAATPIDQTLTEDGVYTRALLEYTPVAGHTLRLMTTPNYNTRDGVSHLPNDEQDEVTLRAQLFKLVSGIEYEASLFNDRLSNVVFGKSYFYTAQAEKRENGAVVDEKTSRARFGGGDSLRLRFTKWLYAKASYEYATRLPRTDEMFGDGALVTPNPDLKPETSHNINAGPRLELKRTALGDFMLDVNGFFRDSHDLIVLLPGKQRFPYENLADTRGRGVENSGSWTSPGRWVGLDGSFTFQDIRNTTKSGTFSGQEGMRVPARPYLFASWGARVHIPRLPKADDALEPYYYGRWVHSFSRTYNISSDVFGGDVPTQLSHNLGLSYLFSTDYTRLGASFEVGNLTDAKLYDTFGVQRPGRAYYLKVTGQI